MSESSAPDPRIPWIMLIASLMCHMVAVRLSDSGIAMQSVALAILGLSLVLVWNGLAPPGQWMLWWATFGATWGLIKVIASPSASNAMRFMGSLLMAAAAWLSINGYPRRRRRVPRAATSSVL